MEEKREECMSLIYLIIYFFKHRGLAIVFSVAALVLIMIVLMNVSIAGQGSK